MLTDHTIKFNKLLTPFSFLYGIGVRFRNQLFDWKILRTERYDLPIICVGNLTVGGTGKTPHTEYIIRLIKDRYRVAVLSRGYKRKTSGFLLTGSIGIFGMFPNASGLFGKLALTTDIVKTNTFSDLGDLSRPMTESEKALIQGYVERGYQTFLSRCAEGRGMTTEAVNAIGQGRVWTGEQAKERGLVDELGGIELAISTAAGLADLDQYSVTTVSGSKNFLDEFLESQLGEVKLSIIKNVLGNEFEYFKTLNNIKTNCGIQARMPYDMKPL